MVTGLLIALSLLLPSLAEPATGEEYLGEAEGLSSNRVLCCIQDSRGFIWIGTDAGLDLYDGQVFRHFSHATHCLAEIDGRIWAGTEDGIRTFSLSDGRLSPFSAVTRYGVNIVSRVNDIAVTDDGSLVWAGTEGQGVFLYNLSTGALSQHSVHTPFAERITPEPDGRVVVTDRDNNLHLYSAAGEYIRPLGEARSAPGDTLIDREGTHWIPTSDRGLVRIPGKKSGTLLYPFPSGTETDGPVPLSEDANGRILVGLRDQLCELDPVSKDFRSYGHISPHGQITQLLPTPEGIWMGTDTDCICRYIPQTRKLIHYHTGGATNALYRPRDGGFLAGTDIGVFSYNEEEDRLVRELTRRDIRILIDGKEPEGTYLKEFNVVSQSAVVAMCEDAGHYLYLATSNRGLFRKDLITDGWEHLVSTRSGASALPWNKITTMMLDRDGTIWSGTSGEGLWFLQKDSLAFCPLLTIDQRLRDSNILGLCQDRSGQLWIGASSGLWRLDPHTGDAIPLGIKAESLLYATDGRLYMGQHGAVASISPENGFSRECRNVTAIREMTVGDSTLYIPPGGRSITLSYLQNSFSITLSALSYADPSGNSFSWQLTGIDPGWTAPGSIPTATYNKVPPGEYVFRVQGSDDTLRLTIRPPWWRSFWAVLAYILFAASLVVFLLWVWQRQLKRRYAILMKKQEEEREKALYKQRIRFFIGLVHEIRTPLTLIRLQHEKDAPGANDSITRNLDYMQDTINKILTYDKNTAGNIEMLRTRMDLREVISAVTDTFRDSASSEGIVLETVSGESPVPVYADEDMLTKILTNLLSNAMKYTRNHITVSVAVEQEDAVVSVTDNGPGVREDQREKIFGMFYTAPGDKVAEASGIGVGLAYARQLAQAHQGELTVENAVPNGASFVLRLPLSKENGSTAVTPKASLSHPGEKLSVLVVEDNRELRETLQKDLSEWYAILTAPDGASAMALIEEKGVDVVVSDIMMPVMDGFDLCRRIKGQLAFSHIPVILLTAKVSLDAKTEGMKSGADAYVEKPFSIRQLRGQIDNLIRLRESFRQSINGSEVLKNSPAGPEADFIRSINQSIEKQMREESFSIESLASDMAMSRTNFFRKFKALTGFTPNDYLKNYRLDHAAALIRDGARINEAAESVGFTSSSYFAKCFKARFGVLPKDFLRSA